jgi:hypothetical protein
MEDPHLSLRTYSTSNEGTENNHFTLSGIIGKTGSVAALLAADSTASSACCFAPVTVCGQEPVTAT